MSQRREVEARLALFDDLSGILGAMRSFALAELRKVGKREAAQQQVVQSLETALADLADSLPEPVLSSPAEDIWLLFGSVRGFCGSFNEDVMRYWRKKSSQQGPLILLGERLHQMVDERAALQRLSGADGGLDAPAAIDRILAAVAELRGGEFGLIACIRDEQGARSQRLWPLSHVAGKAGQNPPLTFAPAAEVAAGVAEHYLFHTLLALLLRSIRVENHMRLMQMETALRHLERGGEELQRQRNRLRQEEIVEEIELMVGRR
ncbi:Sodium-transporting ATPase subunit G [Methylomonas albis]|uniref:F0F1 ATP synthase subunit gamma n=1 Tax=Methylomonas albis TaxID=1854563 RepID=A0ABR9CV04_9GAMM|nr:F0F1 ATP synthase subunit gamma [Methylomonas albis]MBD9354659.1 F0F1 ATP synthase subunit gamma [Methylomonas albis]CAD6877552.1 Sodium-transporting ATPase subunit G [Methylomonas albis]